MPEERTALAFRFATRRDLPRVLAAYRACFDAAQRLRTVAHSPVLFRAFHARLMRRGKCRIALALAGEEVIGFCIVREDGGPAAPWLLSAIGVVASERRAGVARKLFEMVADRPLALSVEEQGPVAFYESLGWARAGERTLVYFKRGQLRALSEVKAPGGAPLQPAKFAALNRSAFLVKANAVTPKVQSGSSARLLLWHTGVLELQGRAEVPAGRFPLVVHEVLFAWRPRGAA